MTRERALAKTRALLIRTMQMGGMAADEAADYADRMIAQYEQTGINPPDPAEQKAGGQAAHEDATERLMRYWSEGEGAAKIRWGEPDDFYRCEAHLGKYVQGDELKGLCARLHHRAIGVWPGQEDGGRSHKSAVPGLSSTSGMVSLDLPEGTLPDMGVADHHITVVFLGSIDQATFQQVVDHARKVASVVAMPTGTVGGIGSFEPSQSSEGMRPVFAVPDVPAAEVLHHQFAQWNQSSHPGYHPHVTLKYADPDEPLPDPLPTTAVQFPALSVHWGGQVVRVPFVMRSRSAPDLTKVGPKGYSHGWIKVDGLQDTDTYRQAAKPQFTEKASHFTRTQRRAYSDYLGKHGGNVSYNDINDTLRGKVPLRRDVAQDLVGMDEAFQQAHLTTPKDMLVARVVRDRGRFSPQHWQPGQTFTDKGYVSTTTLQSGVDVVSNEAHLHGTQQWLLRMTAPAGSPWMPGNDGEHEMIFPRGTSFTVDRVDADTHVVTGRLLVPGADQLRVNAGDNHARRLLSTPPRVINPSGKAALGRCEVWADDLEPVVATKLFDPGQLRDAHGRWTHGDHQEQHPEIRREDLSTPDARRSRPVSAAEFQRIAADGKRRLDVLEHNRSQPTGLDDHWDAIKADTRKQVREPWGGATYDAHTGQPVQSDAEKWALTIKKDGPPVELPEDASDADIDAAMDRARQQFSQELSIQGAHLGVFHDDDQHRIDIDPVLVVDTLDDAESIGAYTHAVGGAYCFADGNGYWPPHVDDTVKSGQAGRQFRGIGEWYAQTRRSR